MKRLEVRFRPEATRDLTAIFRYVLELSRSLTTARGFVQRIRARCEAIGDAPNGGRPRDDLEAGLRTVPFEKTAVIAYKVEGERVRITNIYYGGRNYETLYRGASPTDDDA
jgi:toxin ParE1/3/4